ncbi:MAG: GMC family oxidoreductase [Proteobacteria bacterium]|nr:GMC family oxidoreductase [Pseudomonadota bacterium]
MAEKVDVVIVGSGFGGGIPALRLAEDGRKVVCLEWGKRNTAKDFLQSWDPRYLATLYNVLNSRDFTMWVRRARTLGGGSVLFSGACLRSPREVFDYVDLTGYKVWPDEITREVMNPFYDLVEAKLKIRQVRWDEVPKAGGTFAKMLANLGKTCDRTCFDYENCLQCGFCEAGCTYSRKITLLDTYIPEAESLGAEFRTECEAFDLEKEPGGYRVRYQDRYGNWQEIEGGLVILAASAIETPCILLRSRAHLPNLSSQVGKNYNNNGDIAFYFLLPEGWPSAELYKGRTNAAVMCYAFWAEHRITFHPGCNPPGIFSAVEIHRRAGPGSLPWGLEHKQMVKKYYPDRMLGVLAIGLIDSVGEVGITEDGRPWVDIPMTAYLQNYISRVEGVMQTIAEGNGAELLYTALDGYEHGDAHCLATCRMGRDPARSVCDPYGEVHSYPGLFVSDGSTIPAGTGVNPALTIAANAERIADYIVKNR